MEFVSVWDEAGRDAEAEQSLRALTSARVRAAAFWPFLAAATDRSDFENRLALAAPRIEEAAADSGITAEALTASLESDFHSLLASRMHIVGSFYVTTGDGEKVGGPYDTKADAQDAIDGGDVTGDDLSVSQGDEDSSDDGDDDKNENDDAPDDDTDADDGDDDDENPFAKKESSKVAHNDAEVSQYSSEVANQRDGMGADHPVPEHLQHRAQEVLEYRQDAKDSHSPDMHCNNCGKSHDSGELHQGDDFCPHCGADSRHMEPLHGAHDYGSDDQDPHYGDDIFSHHYEASKAIFPLVKSALPEGVDPLDPIVQTVPSGPGVAEKEIHHGEYVEHPDNSPVSQFTALYKKFAG